MKEKSLHVRIVVTINEDASWIYQEPRAQREVDFSMPIDLFHAPLLTKKIETISKELEKEFDKKVVEAEKEVEGE